MYFSVSVFTLVCFLADFAFYEAQHTRNNNNFCMKQRTNYMHAMCAYIQIQTDSVLRMLLKQNYV